MGAGGTYQRIQVSFLIKGLHVSKKSELLFDKIILPSPALTNWIPEKGTIEEIKDHTFQIPKQEELIKLSLSSINVSIVRRYSREYSYKELRASRECQFRLESDSPINLEIISKLISQLKKLILFLTNVNPEFESFSLYKANEHYELVNTKDRLNDNRFSQNIKVSYGNVNHTLGKVIENWVLNEKLHPVIDLILEKCFNTEMSPQGFFLNICSAFEVYNSSFGGIGKNDPLRERIKKRRQIACLIKDDPLKAIFKQESSSWKNPTLKERIMEFKDVIHLIKGDVFTFDTDEFIAKVVGTRNLIAHTGKYKKHFNNGIELTLASKIMEFTMRLEILKFLGVEINSPRGSLVGNAKQNVEIFAISNEYPIEKRLK
jgi:hypothetical protein